MTLIRENDGVKKVRINIKFNAGPICMAEENALWKNCRNPTRKPVWL